jgi:Nuclease-related domain
MILKELDPFLGRTPAEMELRMAQDRMAYQLRRFFGKSPDVDVLNHLRIGSGSTVALVDHLLLHPFGLIVLERENLTEPVHIQDDGQWMRMRAEGAVEMRSPITRAYLRALSLKAFLDRNVRQKGFFDRIELDVLVAVPNIDLIRWPTMGSLVEVCNPEQVQERVQRRITQCQRVASGPGILTPSERRRLSDFLRSQHRPASRSPVH